MELKNSDNKPVATFKARIEGIPNQDSKGNYQDIGIRRVQDKVTGEVTDVGYNYEWYEFSGVLTSVCVDGQECEIPPDFEINICIESRTNSEYEGGYHVYVKKLSNILLKIKKYSDVSFKGMPQRLEKSRELISVDPTNIVDAHEIYVDRNYIDTIHVERPTRETQKRQKEEAQSRAKERVEKRSRTVKWGLGLRLKWFWRDIVEYITENKIQLLVGFFLTLLGVVIGGLILHRLGIS